MDGVLGLNTYPLAPASQNPDLSRLCPPPKGPDGGMLLFPASSSAAAYNAASMLIFRLDQFSLRQATGKVLRNPPGAEPVKSGAMDTNGQLIPGVPEKSDNACRMSPDLWLSIVSRNSIRPVKILQADDSMFFASSGEHLPNKKLQHNTRTPATWYFSFVLFLILLGVHFRHSRTGGSLGRWLTPRQCDPAEKPLQWKAWILWFGGIILVGIYAVLASSDTPISDGGSCLTILLSTLQWIPFVGFAGLVGWDFWKRREEHLLCWLFLIFAVLAAAGSIGFALHIESGMVLWQQRALDLTSGVSPATPLLVLLLGLYVWFRYSLRGESLVDWRSPQLPTKTELPDRYYRLADSVECIRQKIRPYSPSWRQVDFAALVAVACLALTSVSFGPGHVPIRSLEGRSFDIVYSFLLGVSLVVLIGTLLRLIVLWFELRLMLAGLDRVGMKDALRRLNGFEWKTIWNPAWSVEKEGYRLIAREIQTIERLKVSLGLPDESQAGLYKPLRERIQEILGLRDDMIKIIRGPDECPSSPPSATQLIVPLKQIQRKFAETAGLLCKSFLDISWQHLPVGNDPEATEDDNSKSSVTEINVGTALIKVGASGEADPPPLDPSGLSHNSLRLAEEFVACVYANFLVTVLLRVRGLVFSIVAFYVCIIFSTISYPFEPAPELSTLAIVLFLFSAAAIGYVYEEMHRDPTLSRMTSTDPGKLDSEFWVKFVAAGIAPLIVLVTTVYPPFGHLLYTLVGPLLQALR